MTAGTTILAMWFAIAAAYLLRQLATREFDGAVTVREEATVYEGEER